MKNFKKQKSFILCLAPPVLWVGPKSKFCILSDPPSTGVKKQKKLMWVKGDHSVSLRSFSKIKMEKELDN